MIGLGKGKRHLTRQELLAHAESLLDRAPVDAARAAHLASCPACAAEAAAVRRSLTLLRQVPEMEPSGDLTRQILLSARSVRQHEGAPASLGRRFFRVVQGGLCATALAAAALVVFSTALRSPDAFGGGARGAVALSAPASHSGRTTDNLNKTAEEVKTLTAAVQAPLDAVPTPHEAAQRRAVKAMDTDIRAALAALERNPGCTRASLVVRANLEKQAETLRTLYTERSL